MDHEGEDLMSDVTPTEEGNRSPSLGGRVEELCDRFEAACKANRRPPIEEYLGEVPEADQTALFRELLVLELTYRRRAGERPAPEEYQFRFPKHVAVIETILGAAPPPRAAQPRAGADHNLLFGLLALQNNFIDRDSLVTAFAAWVTDKSRDLGRILLERGAVDAETRALLEALACRHLELHGDDPEESLAALSSLDSVRADLERVGDPELQTSLTRVRRNHDSADPDATVSRAQAAGTPTAAGVRFRVLRLHRTGGLGAVYVARDEELHREVALKEIRDQHAHDPDSRARFVQEAEITGRLEHPGIIPVYGLGTYDDGRPFYAMRFIKGDNLKDAVARFHQTDVPGRDAGERALALRELLGRFLDVCNAMAYAHSRGILHRDLKPNNILLGPYGETLVVDWGLAKPVGRPNEASRTDEATLRPDSAGSSKTTLPGDTPGTPAYMSPEQAAGDVDRLGLLSDVYSLGATLYCLLTGRAPVEDHDVDVVLGKVRRGEFPPPTAVNRAIDPSLEAICLKAMALRPDDRYVTPGALADDIKHWLAGESVSARREPLAERVRRWMRRRRTSVTVTAAVVLMALFGLAVLSAVQSKSNRDLSAKNIELIAANKREMQAKEREHARFDLAMKAIETFHTGVSGEFLLKQEGLHGLRTKLLDGANKFYQKLEEDLKGETDERSLTALGDAYRSLATVTNWTDSKEATLAICEKELAIRQILAGAHPTATQLQTKLAASHFYVGDLQKGTGRPREALQSYDKARAIRQKLADDYRAVAQFQSDLAQSHGDIGLLQAAISRPGDALQSYEKALSIVQKLAEDDPAEPRFHRQLAVNHSNIGNLQGATGHLVEALHSFEKGRAIFQKLAEDDPTYTRFQSDLAGSHYSIGNVQKKTGLRKEALRSYEKARAIRQKLADRFPAFTEYQFDLAASHLNIGGLQEETGQPREALQSYEKARATFQKLADNNPTVPDYQSSVGIALNNIAWIDIQQKQWAAAHDRLVEAIRYQKVALKGSPRHPNYLDFLHLALSNLARTNLALRKPAEAAEAAREMLSISSRDPSILYDFACYLALRVPLAADGSEAARYADEAFGTLKQAVAAGWVDATKTEKDPDLAPLHDRDDFRRLVAGLFDRVFPADPFAR
jgi:eukaryotic-like serine/threonine-protein kinase